MRATWQGPLTEEERPPGANHRVGHSWTLWPEAECDLSWTLWPEAECDLSGTLWPEVEYAAEHPT